MPLPTVQIVQLTGLRALALDHCPYTAGSLEQLSALAPSLTKLRLTSCNLPPSLGSLTALQSLILDSVPWLHAEYSAQLDAALWQMRQLTALVLRDSTDTALPPSAAALPLKRLAFLPRLGFAQAAGIEQLLPALPLGAWTGTCTHLYARSATLAASMHVLQGMPWLRHLCIGDLPAGSDRPPFDPSAWWTCFCVAITSLQSLATLSFDLIEPTRLVPVHHLDDIVWLGRQRPHLDVFRYRSSYNPTDRVGDGFLETFFDFGSRG